MGHKAPTYARSNFELPCGELLVEGALFFGGLHHRLALIVTTVRSAPCTGNRAFRVAFLLIILIMVFCLYQMSNLLATLGELLRLERRPLNQIIVP